MARTDEDSIATINAVISSQFNEKNVIVTAALTVTSEIGVEIRRTSA